MIKEDQHQQSCRGDMRGALNDTLIYTSVSKFLLRVQTTIALLVGALESLLKTNSSLSTSETRKMAILSLCMLLVGVTTILIIRYIECKRLEKNPDKKRLPGPRGRHASSNAYYIS